MTKARGLLIVGLVLLAKPTFAGPVNLSFESGLAGWASIGLVSAETSVVLPASQPTFTVNPTEGSQFALLDSGQSFNSASTTDLEGFFGLSSGSLSEYGGGSGLKQNFDLAAGDMWKFKWNFISGESGETDPAGNPIFPFNDAALFVMTTDGLLVHRVELSNTVEQNGVGTTGWQPFEFTATETRTYLIGVGVFNHPDFDNSISSYLAVDEFVVVPVEGQVPPPTSVPEPGTLLLLTAGFGTTIVSRRFLGSPKERRQLRTL